MENTTVAAISTPLGTGGVGMVRISGPRAFEVAKRIFYPLAQTPVEQMKGYTACYGTVRDTAGIVDESVLLVYRAPRSYTGEDVAEISCHGGLFIMRRVLKAAFENGAEPAQAGEFTKRAFLNGKLSLTQAESVMDLINAQSLSGSRAALSQREGVLFRRVDEIAREMIRLAGHLAAWVDYPEEEIETVDGRAFTGEMERVSGQIETLLSSYETGRILRQGVRTAIVGRPNVGKSTLMNLLSGDERSIVTEIPGTTRDIVEDTVVLGDLVLNLADTAGIRPTDDPVESVGVSRSKSRIETSDLILALFDGSDRLSEEDRSLIERLQGKNCIAVINKGDLERRIEVEEIERSLPYTVEISAKNAEGTERLKKAIEEILNLTKVDPSAAMVVNERQRDCCNRAAKAMREAIEAMNAGVTYDAVSVCLDEAIEALLTLTGERATQAVVDEVFSKFCVGK